MSDECCDKSSDLVDLARELLGVLDEASVTLNNILGPQPTSSDCDKEKPSGSLVELRNMLNRTLRAAKDISTRISCIDDTI